MVQEGTTVVEATPHSPLTVSPAAGTDLWQRTHYGFAHEVAPMLVCPMVDDFVVAARVRTVCTSKYDQAGVTAFAGQDAWVKASCEYLPGEVHSKIGSVVTAGSYSDWGVGPVPSGDGKFAFDFRLARRREVVFIYWRPAPAGEEEELQPWFLCRLAQWVAGDRPVSVGVYACCPSEAGLCASFTRVSVRALLLDEELYAPEASAW